MLKELFTNDSVEAILKIYIPTNPRHDKLSWILNSNSRFTVKFAFKCLQVGSQSNVDGGCWAKLWNLKMHERLNMFI
jgi:hypothetical protein